MSFLSPAMLLAALLAAVPVALHLLSRQPPRVVHFGPIELLRRAEARVRRRVRIRDAALLTARVLLVLLVALALARPVVRAEGAGVAALAGAEALVLVVDDSMSLQVNGAGPFERARRAARGTLDALGPDDAAAVVFAGRPARAPETRLSFDLAGPARAVDDATPSARSTDLPGAVALAARLLQGSALPSRRIVVFTDLQKTAWSAGLEAPRGVSIEVVDVGRDAPNVAVVGVDVEPAAELGAGFARVSAVLAGSGTAPAENVQVSLRVDDATLASASVDVPAGGTARHAFHHAFTPGRLHEGEVTISADALTADDRRAFLIAGPRSLRVLAVDGDPRPGTRRDEVFYLVRALAPGGRSDLAPVVVDPEGLAAERLADYDAVFLCNVPPLARPLVTALETYVQEGGGVFFSGGSRVHPGAWNRAFARLLPARIRAVWASSEGAEAEPVALAPPTRRHPLLSVFPPDGAGLAGGAFTHHLVVDAEADAGVVSQEVLRFTSGAPALLERSIGAGRVLFFVSTLDGDWTDLPFRTGYLPLVQQAVRYLARREASGTRQVRVGDEVTLPLAVGTERVVVRGPGGASQAVPVAPDGRRAVFRDTTHPGVHRVLTEGRVGGLREDRALSFVVATDPAESDLRRLPRAPVAAATLRGDRAASERRLPIWPALLAALVPLLALEAVLRAWRFGAGGRRGGALVSPPEAPARARAGSSTASRASLRRL